MHFGIRIAVAAALAFSASAGMAQSQQQKLQASLEAAAADAKSDKPYLTIKQLRAKYGDAQSRYAKLHGVEVHYKDEGKGPVILLVHGSVSSMKTWDGAVERLKDRYRVIRFDIPGYGLSGRISDKVAATVDPTDIPLALLKKLGVDKVAVASGVSSGGTMVALLAAKNPGLVERLVLSNMPSDPVKTDHLVMPQSFKDALAKAQKTGFQDQNYWKEYLVYWAGVKSRMTPEMIEAYYDLNRRTPEKHPIAMVAQIKDGKETTPLLASLNIPALLVWGAKDPLLPPFTADVLEGYLKQAHVSKIFLPDVGHYPPLEVSERFGDIIANYIEQVTPDLAATN